MTFDSKRIEKNETRIRPSSFPASRGPISGTPRKYARRRYSRPNANAQKIVPIVSRIAVRAARPRSFFRARARAVSHFGASSVRSSSSIQDLDELSGEPFACQAQEDVLEARDSGLGRRAEVVHGAAGADDASLNDRAPVAARLRHLERVRGHHERMSAARVLAEQVLVRAGRLV